MDRYLHMIFILKNFLLINMFSCSYVPDVQAIFGLNYFWPMFHLLINQVIGFY